MIQEGKKFNVFIVADKQYSCEVKEHITHQIHEKIGKDIIINIIEVNNIPRDKSGKLRFFERVE